MASRLFDVLFAVAFSIVASPVFLVAAIGIRICSPGPVFFRARRIGKAGAVFTMYKFRTMRVDVGEQESAITAANDSRVFKFGALLRKLKIDELPQMLNVLRGEMSVVGPRPEDPEIVTRHYTQWHRETLEVSPGLASPGSIYSYTHGEAHISGIDPEQDYVRHLLPIKVALDLVYVREKSILYNIRIILRTAWVVGSIALGRRKFADPPEIKRAGEFICASERR